MAVVDNLWKRIAGYVERNAVSNPIVAGIADTITSLRTEANSLDQARTEDRILERRAKEKLLFFGGWETPQEKEDYLETWYDVLTSRGARTGLENELSRLVKGQSGDPGVTITDMSNADVGFNTAGSPDAAGAFLNIYDAILISATNNSTVRTKQDIERIARTHLIPMGVTPIFDWS